MTIETKYNLEDEVWLMFSNKPCELRIKDVSIHKDINYCTIKYSGFMLGPNGGNVTNVAEDTVYKTKEELLKSL